MHKGQVTISNLIALLMAFIIFFVFGAPILYPLIDNLTANLSASPNQYTAIMISILQLSPLVLVLSILLTALHYAIPKREGYG